MKKESSFIKWFPELGKNDVSIAGGKGASLAEMYNNKFPVPPGFVVTAQAYSFFLDKAGLKNKIEEFLDGIDIENTKQLEEVSAKIRKMIEKAEMPREMQEEIIEAYEILDESKNYINNATTNAARILKTYKEGIFVAVRSSATMEDLADASFAGQQESFLNVKGNEELIKKVKECFASLFTARAVYYRTIKGFAHDKAYLSVVIQKMIDSQKSGVMFSKNPVSNKEEIMIEAVFGLGEGIVSGMINPDSYVVSRDSELKILEEKIADKKIAIARDSSGENKKVKLMEEKSKQRVLNNFEIKKLASYALKLEEHYGKPQDIEFAIEGGIYIVQSRPITTKFKESKGKVEGNELLFGLGASPGIASGTVKIVHSLEDLEKIMRGDILVTEMTNPDMVVAMQRSAGIVTNEGGVTSHASIISREMGIACVVGTGNATEKLKDGMIITVDGTNGKVYSGRGETKNVEIKPIVPTKTKIKIIVDLPDYAERAALSGAKDVGLVRLEGIIAESGKHPLYFVGNPEGYSKIIHFGLKKIAEHFNEIWVRSSDLRSDEFSGLEGAPQEKEENPMLGNHGIRFSLMNPAILEAELMAFKQLAKEMKEKEFGFMMPQVISVDEVKKTKEIMSKIKMPDNVKLGIMVETPAAVQVINELCEEGIKFISFGTNDLTQYILAIDRNNKDIQNLYNEMNPAVLSAISYVIRRCKKYGVETSICGQAASKPEMAEFLVREGIDSVSVNADAAYKISKVISKIEKGEGIQEFIDVIEKPVEMMKEILVKGDSGKEKQMVDSMNKIIGTIMQEKANEDIEGVILKQLEEGDENNKDGEDGGEDVNNNGDEKGSEYNPSIEKERGIPILNEAILIENSFNEILEDETIKEIVIENNVLDQNIMKLAKIDYKYPGISQNSKAEEVLEKVEEEIEEKREKIESEEEDTVLDIF